LDSSSGIRSSGSFIVSVLCSSEGDEEEDEEEEEEDEEVDDEGEGSIFLRFVLRLFFGVEVEEEEEEAKEEYLAVRKQNGQNKEKNSGTKKTEY
jgi:hypothetical protein